MLLSVNEINSGSSGTIVDLTTSIIRKPSQLGFLACAARVSQLLRGRCRMSSTGQASVKSRPKMAMPAYCSVLRHHVCRFRNHINLFSIHKYIRDVYIYIYIRQMPGLCPEPQPRQARHHHHHHRHHRHHHHHLLLLHHHQTLIADLQ